MSHQLPDEIKLQILKANQAHEVAMYWEKTKRRWVHLSAISAFLVAIVSIWLGRPVELTAQTIPMLKPLLTNMHCSSRPAYPPT